jgi:hypothetical protein
MAHHRLAATKRDVEGAVVKFVLPLFVETERHIQHSRSADMRSIDFVKVTREPACCDRHIAHAALEEIPGERGLWQAQHLRAGRDRIDLGEKTAEARQIESVIALFRTKLRYG